MTKSNPFDVSPCILMLEIEQDNAVKQLSIASKQLTTKKNWNEKIMGDLAVEQI